MAPACILSLLSIWLRDGRHCAESSWLSSNYCIVPKVIGTIETGDQKFSWGTSTSAVPSLKTEPWPVVNVTASWDNQGSSSVAPSIFENPRAERFYFLITFTLLEQVTQFLWLSFPTNLNNTHLEELLFDFGEGIHLHRAQRLVCSEQPGDVQSLSSPISVPTPWLLVFEAGIRPTQFSEEFRSSCVRLTRQNRFFFKRSLTLRRKSLVAREHPPLPFLSRKLHVMGQES